ncbi:MAG TPA: F0F1 ATP synthase subunit B' [Methylomirabilota bacterium]|jgi:F-type H+-transporting ATPase subunit b|nr:F0F1 ATP synthase subunit B' [Methylomirabilota bacterium]
MPQLEFADFLPQLFWLSVSFILLYVLMSRFALPKVATVLVERDRQIEEDLARAERLKREADETLRAYDAALREARAEAQNLHRQISAENSALAGSREQAFAADIGARTREAEERIDAAKRRALADLPTVASEVADSAFRRLTGEAPAPERVTAAVSSVLKGSA